MFNRTEVFDLLVHYGGDLNTRDYSGKKPRSYNTIASTVSHDTQKSKYLGGVRGMMTSTDTHNDAQHGTISRAQSQGLERMFQQGAHNLERAKRIGSKRFQKIKRSITFTAHDKASAPRKPKYLERGHDFLGHDFLGHGFLGHDFLGHDFLGHGFLGHGFLGHGFLGHGFLGHDFLGHDFLGHDFLGHDFLGHDFLGHDFLGHDFLGHGFLGHGFLGHDFLGHDFLGHDFLGHDFLGHGFLGHDFLGHDFLGHDFLGHDFLGHDFLGHDFLGHGFLGHDFLGHDFLGHGFLGHGFLGHDFLGHGFLVKEAAGFLRIGSLNVKVRKTTEAFNNLLSRDVEARLHRTWGSSDSLPDAEKESKSMPPPKFGPIKKRKTKKDRDFVQTRPVSAYSALAPTDDISPHTAMMPSMMPSMNADSDSDSAYGFGSEWH
nr:uncharacterized protein LOC128698988 [Cherax quadricarinatus]